MHFQDEDISGCRLKRKLDGKREINYTIPANVVVHAGRSVKVSLPMGILNGYERNFNNATTCRLLIRL